MSGQLSRKGFLVKSFLAHHVIFSEGSKGDTAYLLTEGEVEISTSVENRKKVLARLTPPALFGEMALFLDDNTRTATAMTLADSKMVLITRDSLDDYLDGAPQVIASIMNVLVHRLKATTKKASRAPNVPMGICRVLHLLQLNGVDEVRYDSLVRHLAETFQVGAGFVEGYLAELAEQGHVAVAARDDAPEKRLLRILSGNLLDDVLQLTRGMQV